MWSWGWDGRPIRSRSLARTCPCSGGKVKVKLTAYVHIKSGPVSFCKTFTDSHHFLANMGYWALYSTIFWQVQFPAQSCPKPSGHKFVLFWFWCWFCLNDLSFGFDIFFTPLFTCVVNKCSTSYYVVYITDTARVNLAQSFQPLLW